LREQNTIEVLTPEMFTNEFIHKHVPSKAVGNLEKYFRNLISRASKVRKIIHQNTLIAKERDFGLPLLRRLPPPVFTGSAFGSVRENSFRSAPDSIASRVSSFAAMTGTTMLLPQPPIRPGHLPETQIQAPIPDRSR
jgi:hypothetical protein